MWSCPSSVRRPGGPLSANARGQASARGADVNRKPQSSASRTRAWRQGGRSDRPSLPRAWPDWRAAGIGSPARPPLPRTLETAALGAILRWTSGRGATSHDAAARTAARTQLSLDPGGAAQRARRGPGSAAVRGFPRAAGRGPVPPALSLLAAREQHERRQRPLPVAGPLPPLSTSSGQRVRTACTGGTRSATTWCAGPIFLPPSIRPSRSTATAVRRWSSRTGSPPCTTAPSRATPLPPPPTRCC